MNAEQPDKEQAEIPAGLLLPSDPVEARDAIEQALEEQAEQMRAAAFIARLETRQRVATVAQGYENSI